jgi:hypothetical protein
MFFNSNLKRTAKKGGKMKLNRCPFCGGRAEMVEGYPLFLARCANVKCVYGRHPRLDDGDGYSEKDAAKFWNRRRGTVRKTTQKS